MLQKASRTTFKQRLDEMVVILKREIESGKRAPGDHLPSEYALGEQFHLSKNSVRKGLAVLVAEGLIEKVPRVGNIVRAQREDERTTLRFGYYGSLLAEAELKALLDRFQAEHPKLRVQLIPLPYINIVETVQEYIDAGMLDVLMLNDRHFLQFTERDQVDWMETTEENTELYGFVNKAYSDGARQYAHPFVFSPVVLCYNRDHFESKGVPEPDGGWSWQDVIDSSVRLSEGEERSGFYCHMPSNNRWPIFLLQCGQAFERDASGKAAVCGSGVMEGIRLTNELLYNQGNPLIVGSDADAESLFLQGKVSMIMTTYLNLNAFRGAVEFPFEIAPLPYFRVPRTLLVAVGLAVVNRSKVKEAARSLVDYLTSYEAQLHIRQYTYSIPGHKKAAEWIGEEKMYRPYRFHMYREIIPTFASISDLKLKSDQLEPLRRELMVYWSRMVDEETICRKFEEIL
ncbi:MAG TPA: extracellular solute-binding protein [Paenibacillus sp.]|nr:extracellular solute-binding protein [Paenibacillus sp.]